ncbi:flavin monoamine oxidase family protein [Roseibium sp. MB-4]
MHTSVNVVVVGAGAAGLAAAAQFNELGLSCQVIEAQNRVGGRVRTLFHGNGRAVDLGAQMINADMRSVLDLARTGSLHCSVVPNSGQDLCVIANKVFPRDEFIDQDTVDMVLEARLDRVYGPSSDVRFFDCLTTWFRTVGFRKPFRTQQNSRDASVLRMSVADVLRMLPLSTHDKQLARTQFCEQYGVAAECLNALAVKQAFQSYQSDRPDLEFHFPEGMEKITDQLAGQLSFPPKLNARVERVSCVGQRVEVVTGADIWLCDFVVIAVPPPAASKISFVIEESKALRDLLGSFQPGSVIKTTLEFRSAFWRLHGWSGRISFTDPMGLEVVDTSFDDSSPPRLTAFLGGPKAAEWASLNSDHRIAKLLDLLALALGDEARTPKSFEEALWVEGSVCGGGYNSSVRVEGVHNAAQKLREWTGRVRFAGAELDTAFAGYVEGAIRNGRAVAAEIAHTLHANGKPHLAHER